MTRSHISIPRRPVQHRLCRIVQLAEFRGELRRRKRFLAAVLELRDVLPIGLQLLAGPFEEEKLLRAARMYERATQWHTRRAAVAAGPRG
jgi:hypothetical protein